MTTKVRVVRCPKCWLILPELPEIPLYKCGGCNTILQAKLRKPDMKEASHDHETDEHDIKEVDCVSTLIHSSKDATVSPIDESSPPITSKCDDNIETMGIQEVPLSPERNFTQYEDSLMEQDKGNSVIDNNGERHQGRRHSDDVPISIELTSNEMEDSSYELQPIIGTEEDTYDTDQYTGGAEKIRRGKGKRDYFEGSNISDDLSSSSVMLNSSPESGTHEQTSKSVQDSTGSSFAFLRPELLDSKELDPIDDSKSPSDENISVNSVISPDNQHESAADSLSHLPVTAGLDFVKFPTRSYYGCDASVSSYDGMDELVHTRSSKPPRRKLKPPPSITSEDGILSSEAEMLYRGYNSRSRANDPMSSESEVQHLGKKATFLETNRIPMKYGRYDQDYGVSKTRPQNKDYMQMKDGPLPTNYKGRYSSFVSQEMLVHNEPDKFELLKMINELKDELNRTRISNSSFPARFTESASARGPRVSRMAYSGEASDYSLRGNCNGFHCFPQGHNYSSGLPLHGMYSNEAHHLVHNGHAFNKGSCSESSSRQLGFRFSQEHKTMSDDRKHNESEFVGKRYIRAASGGIPILSCYHCSELLLLPADFLLTGRRCNQLKCNRCKNIMKFSLKSKKHLVPCVPDVVAPPPSVVNEYSDSNGGPISFSDEYGMSIDRSCSIKSEQQHGNNLNNRILNAAAFKPFNDQKARFNMRSTGKGKLNKELPPKSGGVLHTLMGYSSPSQVIRRH